MNDILKPPGSREPEITRIHEIDIPLPTTNPEQLKKACLVPVYQPGLAILGDKSAPVKSPDGKQGQVMIGHAQGFTGGEALIIRETSLANAAFRARCDALEKGMRVLLELDEHRNGIVIELVQQAQVGEDAQTSARLRELEAQLRDLGASAKEFRHAFFPDDAPKPAE